MSEDFNMTRLSELRKKRHELNEQLIELNNQQYQLEQQEQELVQERLRPLVGNTYQHRETGVMFYVYSVPIVRYDHVGHSHFNPYELPVIKIGVDNEPYGPKVPINFISTVFTKAAFEEDPVAAFKKKYKEIPFLDFLEEHREKLIKFYEDVKKENNI